MILIDSSVWIDVLTGRDTLQTAAFERLAVDEQDIGLGDLVMVEVLQGIRHDRDYRRTVARLSLFEKVLICDHKVSIQAARYYRHLRSMGITIGKTIDTLIATRCILDGIPLLYSDRNFDPFVRHLGLRSALDLPGVS